MTKKLLVILLLLIGADCVQAQTVKATFGMKATGAYTLTNTEITPDLYGLAGGGAGLFAGINIARIIGIQVEGIGTYQYGSFHTEERGNMLISNQVYLHIPVVLQFCIGKVFSIEGGYQQSIAMMGTLQNGTTSGDPVQDNGILDYGSAVAGVNFNMGKVVSLNIRYCHALTNTYVMTKEPSKNQSLQISLAFRFFTSKKSVFK